MSLRNPKEFKVGERVRVSVQAHRDFGKEGVIEKLEGVDTLMNGKPRAHICISAGKIENSEHSVRVTNGDYIHVSLPESGARMNPWIIFALVALCLFGAGFWMGGYG